MFAPASWSRAGRRRRSTRRCSACSKGPRYATLWDLDRKLLELQQLTLQRDKDVAAYQAVVQKAWNLAFERFTKALTPTAGRQASATWRGLTDRGSRWPTTR